MNRSWLVAAAIGGFLSVAAGGAAAHLAATDGPAELLRTGALYGMIHAVALIAVTAIAKPPARADLALTVAGWSFSAGTPFGGVGLLIGWAALGVHAVRRAR